MVLARVLGVWGVGGNQTREQKVEDLWVCGKVYKGMYTIDKRGLYFISHSLVAPPEGGAGGLLEH
jgi:hypothetical protein